MLMTAALVLTILLSLTFAASLGFQLYQNYKSRKMEQKELARHNYRMGR